MCDDGSAVSKGIHGTELHTTIASPSCSLHYVPGASSTYGNAWQALLLSATVSLPASVLCVCRRISFKITFDLSTYMYGILNHVQSICFTVYILYYMVYYVYCIAPHVWHALVYNVHDIFTVCFVVYEICWI